MDIDERYLYTKDHEWVFIDGDTAVIGISDHAQEQLGDVTFIQLPAVGDEVEQFEQIASVESVKAASDIFSPISGKVIDVNSELDTDPGLVNRSPYENGWLAKIEISDSEEASNLMTAEEYQLFLESNG
jgi:glycine cleavage system H protein